MIKKSKKKDVGLKDQATVAALINELEDSTLKAVNNVPVVANKLKIVSQDASVTINTSQDPDATTVNLHATGGGVAGVASLNGKVGDVGISGISPVVIGQSGNNVTVEVDTGVRRVNTIAPDATGNFKINAGTNVSVATATNGITISASGGSSDGIKTINNVEPNANGMLKIGADGPGINVNPDPNNNQVLLGVPNYVRTINNAAPSTATQTYGNFSIAAGNNINVATSGSTVTISATGGGGGIQTIDNVSADANGNIRLEPASNGVTIITDPDTNAVKVGFDSVVTSVNGVQNEVTFVSNNENIDFSTSGQNIRANARRYKTESLLDIIIRGCLTNNRTLNSFYEGEGSVVLKDIMPEAISKNLTNNKATTDLWLYFEWAGGWQPDFFKRQGVDLDNGMVISVDVYNADANAEGNHLILENVPLVQYRMRGDGHIAMRLLYGNRQIFDKDQYTDANTFARPLVSSPFNEGIPNDTWVTFENFRCTSTVYSGNADPSVYMERNTYVLGLLHVIKKYTLGL